MSSFAGVRGGRNSTTDQIVYLGGHGKGVVIGCGRNGQRKGLWDKVLFQERGRWERPLTYAVANCASSDILLILSDDVPRVTL